MIRRFLIQAIIALSVVFAICMPTFGQGQLSIIEGNLVYAREVLVQGGSALSPAVNNIVAQALTDRFADAAPADGPLKIVGVELIAQNARVSDDVQICNLAVYYRGAAGTKLARNDKQLDELWEKGRQQLEASLRQVKATAWNQRQEAHNNELGRRRDRKLRMDVQLQNAVETLQKLQNESGGSPVEAESRLSQAVTQLWQLRLSRISLTARREAIEKRIDEVRKAAEQRVVNDPMLDELDTIVKIREQQLALIKQRAEAGVVVSSAAEMQEAAAAISAARIDLLKAKRAANADANGAVLAALNDELSKLYVDDAEMEAKTEALERMVKELREQTSIASRTTMESAEHDVKRFREGLEQAEDAYAEIDVQQIDESPITIRPLEDVLPAAEAEAAAK